MVDLATQIANANADRRQVPELCRTLLAGTVVIIGGWADEQATKLLIQEFRLQGQLFIPFFSDTDQFWSQMLSTPFSRKGMTVEC